MAGAEVEAVAGFAMAAGGGGGAPHLDAMRELIHRLATEPKQPV